MIRMKRILKNPYKKKSIVRIFGYNVFSLILLIIFILNLSFTNINLCENNTYEITGVITNVEKPHNKPNSTPIIIITIGNIDYRLLVNDSYKTSDLLYEINTGTEIVAKVAKYKTMVVFSRLYDKEIIVDLRNDENIFFDIETENMHRKINFISISSLFVVLWIIVCVLSILYIRFVL